MYLFFPHGRISMLPSASHLFLKTNWDKVARERERETKGKIKNRGEGVREKTTRKTTIVGFPEKQHTSIFTHESLICVLKFTQSRCG